MLERDHLLEFVITAYNACGVPLELRGVDGKISFKAIGGTLLTALVYLPMPQLVIDRSFQKRHENLATFQLKIAQWVPHDVAAEFVSRLRAGPLLLDIGELRIIAAPTNGPLQTAKLKIADTATLTSDKPAEAQLGVILKASVSNLPAFR